MSFWKFISFFISLFNRKEKEVPPVPRIPRPKVLVSDRCVNLVKKWEGFHPNVYLCPAGIPTIGYGETRDIPEERTITEAKATYLLENRLEETAREVLSVVEVDLAQHELDAITSLVYNIGIGALKKSKALQYLNEGNRLAFVQEAFHPDKGFVRANGTILKGLQNRRADEKRLFNGKA